MSSSNQRERFLFTTRTNKINLVTMISMISGVN